MITGALGWRGADLMRSTDRIHRLHAAGVAELERALSVAARWGPPGR
jgi:hypothetical protein